jgi:hypothetical protein
VSGKVLPKDAKGRSNESYDTVRVMTGSSSDDHPAPFGEVFEGDLGVATPDAEFPEIGSERGEPEGARSALSGTLVGHPLHHPLGLSNSTP